MPPLVHALTDTPPDAVKYTLIHIYVCVCVCIFENLLKSLASDLCSTFQKLFFLIDLKFRQRITSYLAHARLGHKRAERKRERKAAPVCTHLISLAKLLEHFLDYFSMKTNLLSIILKMSGEEARWHWLKV